MTEENVRIVQRWSEEMWSGGDLGVADQIFAEDVVDHDPLPGQVSGREGAKQSVAMFREAFPDLAVTNEDVIAVEDKVVVRWTARGTHRVELMGVAPTNRELQLKGIDIVRVVNGRIVERWGEFDGLGMMAQLQAQP